MPYSKRTLDSFNSKAPTPKYGALHPEPGYILGERACWEEADNFLLVEAVKKWSYPKILVELKQKMRNNALGTRCTKGQAQLNQFENALKNVTYNRWPKARSAIIVLQEANNRNLLERLAHDIAAWAAAEEEEAENRQAAWNCESDDDLPDMSAKKQKA